MALAYLLEREGGDVVTEHYGFMHYSLGDNDIFIRNMYIDPDYRGQKKPKEILEKIESIGREEKKQYVTCQCDINEENPERSIKNILNNGFKVIQLNGSLIQFAKEL